MKAYASRTGTAVNLAALRRAGWGLLVSATGAHRNEGFEDIILDNGAWTAYNSGVPWYRDRFWALLRSFGSSAKLVVAPDIVAGGEKSLDLSASWLPELSAYPGITLLPVQDGMTAEIELDEMSSGGTMRTVHHRKSWGAP